MSSELSTTGVLDIKKKKKTTSMDFRNSLMQYYDNCWKGQGTPWKEKFTSMKAEVMACRSLVTRPAAGMKTEEPGSQ